MNLKSERLKSALSNRNWLCCLYCANSFCHCDSPKGGNIPVKTSHFVIDSPEPVKRVIPLKMTWINYITTLINIHMETARLVEEIFSPFIQRLQMYSAKMTGCRQSGMRTSSGIDGWIRRITFWQFCSCPIPLWRLIGSNGPIYAAVQKSGQCKGRMDDQLAFWKYLASPLKIFYFFWVENSQKQQHPRLPHQLPESPYATHRKAYCP